jgi:hypothetical protein
MNAFFTAQPKDAADIEADRLQKAYEKGRAQERTQVHDPAVTDRTSATEVDVASKRAYERGRRDERARRHGSPLLTVVLLLAAAAGAVVLYLAISQGSFARGGALVDQNLSNATQTVAAKAGDALQNAGANLKNAQAPASAPAPAPAQQ